VARVIRKSFSALEIAALRNLLIRARKDYPRELCEHLGRLRPDKQILAEISTALIFASLYQDKEEIDKKWSL
jgi:hypothetical protein